MQIGTAVSKPGTIQYGRWEALKHPTGHSEFLPVIIAQGKVDGPCLWLTAGIHGNEHGGPNTIYQLLTEDLVARLRGTVVAIPALNPAGLRTGKRSPYHVPKDPNRLWPDGKPEKVLDPDKSPPSSLEMAYKRLFDDVAATADYLIDLHSAWIGSLSFAFRDQILYRTDGDEEGNKLKAEALAARQGEMLQAYGHTVLKDFPVIHGLDEDLHRSVSTAVMYLARIPTLTVELSTDLVPDLAVIAAAAAGHRNVMRWADMLDGDMEPIEGIKVVDPGYPVRRCNTPRVEEACIVAHLVEPGDPLTVGQPVGETRDAWGRPVGEGVVRSEYDGFVLGRSHGAYYYPGDPVLFSAIRDTAPLVVPYPNDFFA
ncbi:succinylglutamate desuccinylase/aspartoacylase family protein [Chloroflexota bacterium]